MFLVKVLLLTTVIKLAVYEMCKTFMLGKKLVLFILKLTVIQCLKLIIVKEFLIHILIKGSTKITNSVIEGVFFCISRKYYIFNMTTMKSFNDLI
jgi:hypothetical protein